MKIALLSDIHGNMPALQVVADHIMRWQPDVTVVNGDILNRGPRPRQCWEFVQQQSADAGWQLTRGNHEEYVLAHIHGTYDRFFPMSHWTMEKMRGHFEGLANLQPVWSRNDPQFGQIRVTHASLAGSQRGIYPLFANSELEEMVGPGLSLLGVGHTHLPLIKLYKGCLIVNAGSVGQPAWGETRACYAQITFNQGAWTAEIIRLPYDREQTDRDFKESGILAETDLFTQVIYHEWRTGLPLLMAWIHEYYGPVKGGEIDEAEQVKRFLADHRLPIVGSPPV